MRVWALSVVFLSGCFWVTKDELKEAWDKDGDGWGLEEDCNDDNAAVHPYAADYRGDGCDADCGMELDSDSDDWPDDADCDDGDANVYPCSTTANGDQDVDCDGIPGVSRPDGDCDYARPDPDFEQGQEPITSNCRP